MGKGNVKNINRVSLGNKLLRALWNSCYMLLFRTLPTRLFWPWRWCLLRIFGAKVDFKTYVYSSTKIWAPWNLHMEEGACLGPHVICYNQAMVTLKSKVTVSQYAYLCTASHDTSQPNTAEKGLLIAPITIGNEAWVGTRAFIGMGVEVGNGAVVGATASVYKDVEPHTIVGGNPAKIIKRLR